MVYHDGTVSADNITSKSPVAVCFMLNPKNHRQGLFVSVSDLSETSISGSGTTTFWQWGLYNSTDSNNGMAGVTLADSPTYNVYDIANINNIGSGQFSSADSYFRDETNTENAGWKVYTDTSSTMSDIGFVEITQTIYDKLITYLTDLGLKVGDCISVGQLKTLYIILHRDKILQDSGIALPVPKASDTEAEQENLSTCLINVYKNNENKGKYCQYYPAASRCYAYSPIKNIPVARQAEMNSRLEAHHWHLMSIGEMERFTWHTLKGKESSTEWAIFAKAFNNELYNWPGDSVYWTASE